MFLILTCHLALCQLEDSYFIRHFETKDGLSNNWISDINQDSEGFIWVGTQYGLNRYDGNEFEVYTYRSIDTSSISANWVKSVLPLSNERLYVGTQGGGLNILNPKTGIFKMPSSKLATSSFSDIAAYTNDKVLYSTSSGAFSHTILSDSIIQVIDEVARTVIASSANEYLIATTNGIKSLSNERIDPKIILEGKYIMDFLKLNPDSLLAYADNNLYLIEKTDGVWQKEVLVAHLKFPDQSRFWPFIYKEKSGKIWISNGRMVWQLSKNLEDRKEFVISELLKTSQSQELSVQCMMEDKEGSLWFGTNLGLFQLVKSKNLRHPFLHEMNLPLAKTRGITECGNYIWFSNFEGLYAWDRQRNKPPTLITDQQIRAIYGRSDGYLYYTATTSTNHKSIFRINSKTFKIENLQDKIDIDPSSIRGSFKIIEDQSKRLWFTNWNDLLCYHPETHKTFFLEINNGRNKLKPAIIDMTLDKEDNLWIGSMLEGLIKIPRISQVTAESLPNIQQYKHDKQNPKSISTNLIQSVHKANDDDLWVGTDGGINVLNVKTGDFKKYLRDDQLPDDKILTISSDNDGKVWMGSISHGILSYNPMLQTFKSYTTVDGLYDDAMLLNSIYKDAQGHMWMGSTSGLQYFDPLKITNQQDVSPNLTLLSITKNQEDSLLIFNFPTEGFDPKNPMIINAKDKSVTWKFATLTYTHPEKVRYKFQLKKLHSTWLAPQKDGVFTFTNLPTGHQELQIEIFSEDGSWLPVNKTYFLKVNPPWYKSTLAYASYIFLTSLFIGLIYKIRIRQKLAVQEQEYLKNLTQTKSHWFQQIAHEFRTPLTVILGAATQWKDKLSKNEEHFYRNHFDQIKEQTTHLSKQVDQILEIAQLTEGFPQINNRPGNFIMFQKSILYSFQSYAIEKNINLEFKSNIEILNINFDEDKWRKISSNILSNAIKYTPDGGKIQVEILQADKKTMDLVISDNGHGISQEFLPKIFDPFTRERHLKEAGIGLGLNLIKELVTLLGGTIRIESKVNKGTIVSVHAPIEEIVTGVINQPTPLDYHLEEKLTVLVAEDNADVTAYLKHCLNNYHVIEANDGQKAWEACLKFIPDLVVSDIMMPYMSGLDLVAMIRKHPITNHIPVILLTSKVGTEFQLKGLKAGAEVYLTKPFDRDQLIIRVHQLLSLRAQLKDKYQQGEFLNISNNKSIDSFFKSIVKIITENIDNENFTVEDLAKATFMSRVHLFRKLKSTAGMSPSQLIRKVKMKKAKDLLNTSELSISEVAYATGFKDAAYFSRVFSEEFGHPPSKKSNIIKPL